MKLPLSGWLFKNNFYTEFHENRTHGYAAVKAREGRGREEGRNPHRKLSLLQKEIAKRKYINEEKKEIEEYRYSSRAGEFERMILFF